MRAFKIFCRNFQQLEFRQKMFITLTTGPEQVNLTGKRKIFLTLFVWQFCDAFKTVAIFFIETFSHKNFISQSKIVESNHSPDVESSTGFKACWQLRVKLIRTQEGSYIFWWNCPGIKVIVLTFWLFYVILIIHNFSYKNWLLAIYSSKS